MSEPRPPLPGSATSGRRTAARACAGILTVAFWVAAVASCSSSNGDTSPRDASTDDARQPAADASTHDSHRSTHEAGASGASVPDEGPSVPTKSLRADFGAACDGTTDDHDAVAAAMAAAAGNAFVLTVDGTCKALVHVGMDITKPIFVESGTSVEMQSGAAFVLDSVSIPTFELADTNDVVFTDWNLLYEGSLPVSNTTWVGGHYNDDTLKPYLEMHRGINFDPEAGWVSARWASPTNMCALFDLRGSTANVTFTGLKVTGGATGDRFVPMVFSITAETTPYQTISASTPITSPVFAVPSHLTFDGVTLDGTYFGWQGAPASSTFTNVTSLRYADLQDADGGSVGGASCPGGDGSGCEFAPPHLFYFNEGSAGSDPNLWPHDNTIRHVRDMGVRVGVARNPKSGNACSVKFGGANSTLDDYTSARPDGLMDVLASSGNTISNVTASYDSTFCGDSYPIVRFPGNPYASLVMKDMTLKDTAATTDHPIFPGSSYPGSITDATVTGISVTVAHYTGSGDGIATFAGTTNDTLVAYAQTTDQVVRSAGEKNAVVFELSASPSTVAVGSTTTVTWSTSGATSCTASGAWSGSLATKGTESVKVAKSGSHTVKLSCTDGKDVGVAEVTVVGKP